MGWGEIASKFLPRFFLFSLNKLKKTTNNLPRLPPKIYLNHPTCELVTLKGKYILFVFEEHKLITSQAVSALGFNSNCFRMLTNGACCAGNNVLMRCLQPVV